MLSNAYTPLSCLGSSGNAKPLRPWPARVRALLDRSLPNRSLPGRWQPLLAGAMLLALPLSAAAVPQDAEQPIHIQADRAEIDRIVAQSAQSGHGVRDLLRLVVTSEIFRSK